MLAGEYQTGGKFIFKGTKGKTKQPVLQLKNEGGFLWIKPPVNN